MFCFHCIAADRPCIYSNSLCCFPDSTIFPPNSEGSIKSFWSQAFTPRNMILFCKRFSLTGAKMNSRKTRETFLFWSSCTDESRADATSRLWQKLNIATIQNLQPHQPPYSWETHPIRSRNISKNQRNQDGPAVAMQIFEAKSKSNQRGSRARCFARASAFLLLPEHNNSQMSWLVLLGFYPSAGGPNGTEITSMRVPLLRNLCCTFIDTFSDHIRVLTAGINFL